MAKSEMSIFLLPLVTCPTCWNRFPPEEILWVATHGSLIGDSRSGAAEYRRFLPTLFTVDGQALDEKGEACQELACPPSMPSEISPPTQLSRQSLTDSTQRLMFGQFVSHIQVIVRYLVIQFLYWRSPDTVSTEPSPYAPPTNLCGDTPTKARSLTRPAACGALIVITAGPAFGILHYIYLWFSTGDAIHLKEALALFVTATVMGAGAGAAYGYLSTQSLPSWRRRFVICLVTMEAYLGLGTAIILLMYFLTPSLVVDLPAADPLFHVYLHAYGFIIVCLGTGIAYLVMCFRRAK